MASYFPPAANAVNGSWASAPPYTSVDANTLVTLADFSAGGKSQGISPDGIDAGAFGEATLGWHRTYELTGYDAAQYGQAIVLKAGEYLFPSAVVNASWSGAKPFTPYGSHLPGVWTRYISGDRQRLQLTGIDGGGFGLAMASRPIMVRPSGEQWVAFGAAAVDNLMDTVAPSGIAPPAITKPAVRNQTSYVSANGIASAKYGKPAVANFRAILKPTGISATLYGTAAFSGGVRYLAGKGFANFAAGKPFVAYRQREVKPAGIKPGAFGIALIGYNHEVGVPGIDAGYWGRTQVLDNRQTIYLPGINSARLGDTYVGLLRRTLSPAGIAPTIEWGLPETLNRRQYVRQQADERAWGERFGTYTYVDNRNRTITNYGWNSARFGYTEIALGGRAILLAGRDSALFGSALVADRIRSVGAAGLASELFGRWLAVSNAARVVATAGHAGQAFGLAGALNTRRTLAGIGGMDSLQAGLPFVADRIRQVAPYRLPDPPSGGQPTVMLLLQHVSLTNNKGIPNRDAGYPDVHIYKGIVYPRWNISSRVGEPSARNLTPEVGIYGHDSASFGRAAARNQWETYRIQGFTSLATGKPVVERRTKTVQVGGMRAGAFGATSCLWGQPDLPYTRTLEVAGAVSKLAFGGHKVQSNELFVTGIAPGKLGTPTTHANSIYPPSYFRSLFGIPSLNVTQFIKPKSLEEPDDPSRPVLSPLTVWAPRGAPAQASINHGGTGQYMDGELPGGGVAARPFFGVAKVWMAGPQKAAPTGRAMGGMGNLAWVSLRHRTLAPDGLRSLRVGYPDVSKGGEAFVYGYEMLQMGRPAVEGYIDPHAARTVSAKGSAQLKAGEPDVQNYNRAIAPTGLLSARHGKVEVGPPKRADAVSSGVASLYGAPMVSLKNRALLLAGIDTWEVAEYEGGKFDQRMTVGHDGKATLGALPAGDGERFGWVNAVNAQQVMHQIGCCSFGLRMGRPIALSA